MKKIVTVISLFFLCFSSNAQENNQINKMLIESLRSFVNYKSELRKKNCINCEILPVYVCKDGLPANFPYDSLDNVTFFSVDCIQVYSCPIKKQFKKGIMALFVSIELESNQLCITVSDRLVELISKNHVGINVNHWGDYFYKYSCDKQEWDLIDTQYGGV